MIAELSNRKRTRVLRDQVDTLLQGYDFDTILAVLVPIIVTINIHSVMDDDEVVCPPCASGGLTDILQATRRVHDQALEQIPLRDHRDP